MVFRSQKPKTQRILRKPIFSGFFYPLFYTKFAFCIKRGVTKNKGYHLSLLLYFLYLELSRPFAKNVKVFFYSVWRLHRAFVSPPLRAAETTKKAAALTRPRLALFALLTCQALTLCYSHSQTNRKGVRSCYSKKLHT